MTKETDHIIDYVITRARASGVVAVVSDINTPKAHTKVSDHYKEGTPSSRVEPLDFKDGKQGQAVDFVHQHGGQPDSAQLAAIFNLLRPVEYLLDELFHSGPRVDHYVKRGVVYPIARLDRAVFKIHHDHVHVGVAKGVLLPTQGRPVKVPKEQAMTLVIEPVGAVERPQHDGGWAFGKRGHVYAYGNARHLDNWDEATRNDPSRWCVALVPTASGEGYWLVSNKGEVYAYGDAPQTGNYQIAWGLGEIIGAYRNDRQRNGGVTLVRDDSINLNTYALPA